MACGMKTAKEKNEKRISFLFIHNIYINIGIGGNDKSVNVFGETLRFADILF